MLTNRMPYASPDGVIKVIQEQRRTSVPDKFSREYLERVGIGYSSQGRLLQSLRFIKIADDHGVPTENCRTIADAGAEDYRAFLAQLVGNAYQLNLSGKSSEEWTYADLSNAFQRFEPKSQKPRMITLFLGLCSEAGIITKIAPEKNRVKDQDGSRASHIAISRPRQIAITASHSEQQANGSVQNDRNSQWYSWLLNDLPEDRRWSQEEHDTWLAAFSACLKQAIKIDPNEAR